MMFIFDSIPHLRIRTDPTLQSPANEIYEWACFIFGRRLTSWSRGPTRILSPVVEPRDPQHYLEFKIPTVVFKLYRAENPGTRCLHPLSYEANSSM
jgi:hypothetical protein